MALYSDDLYTIQLIIPQNDHYVSYLFHCARKFFRNSLYSDYKGTNIQTPEGGGLNNVADKLFI